MRSPRRSPFQRSSPYSLGSWDDARKALWLSVDEYLWPLRYMRGFYKKMSQLEEVYDRFELFVSRKSLWMLFPTKTLACSVLVEFDKGKR